MTKFSLRDDNEILFILFVEYFHFIGRDFFVEYWKYTKTTPDKKKNSNFNR